MSNVVVFEVRENTLRVFKRHYRDVLKAFNNGMKFDKGKNYPLDAGYMIIDYDKRVLMSSQSGFGFFNIDKNKFMKLSRNWRMIEVSWIKKGL